MGRKDGGKDDVELDCIEFVGSLKAVCSEFNEVVPLFCSYLMISRQ